MKSATAEACVSIVARNRAALDEDINAAVNQLLQLALPSGARGILITRHTDRHLTVALSGDVPFGYTHEHDSRR